MSRKLRLEGNVARMGERKNELRVLVGKAEGKRSRRNASRKWVDHLTIDLRERGWGGMH
jgi:hypothetical protein